jgi:hypothetical protein
MGGSNQRTGYKEVAGQRPDISKWLDFEFYDLEWWLDQPTKPNITDDMRRLVRWLGVSQRVGSNMSYWLITPDSKIILKTSVEHVTQDDDLLADKKTEIDKFNRRLKESLNDENFIIEGEGKFESLYHDDIEDDDYLGIAHIDDIDMPNLEVYRDICIQRINPKRPMNKH